MKKHKYLRLKFKWKLNLKNMQRQIHRKDCNENGCFQNKNWYTSFNVILEVASGVIRTKILAFISIVNRCLTSA